MAAAPGYFDQIKYVTNGTLAYVTWSYVPLGAPAEYFFVRGLNTPTYNPNTQSPAEYSGLLDGSINSFGTYLVNNALDDYAFISATYYNGSYDQKNSTLVSSNANASPVTSLQASSPTRSSITISWNAPDVYTGSITTYRVYQKLAGDPWPSSYVAPNAGATSHVFSSLSDGTAYSFMVIAVTNTGASTFDNEYQTKVTASTLPVVVPGAPSAPAATRGAASGSADLTWNAPVDNGGAPIDLYRVEYSSDNGTTWTQAFTTGAMSGTVTGLTNGTGYVFRVLAHNFKGYGPASDSSSSVTPGTAPDAPAAPTGTIDDRKSLVSWLAPAANGYSVTSYVVEYKDSSGTYPGGTVAAPALSLLVSPLTGGMTYNFRVAAINAVGQSDWSPWSADVIPTGLPEAPVSIVATQIDADATNAVIKIEITPPAVTGGKPIDNYRLEAAYSTDGGVTWGAWDIPEYPFVPDQTNPWYQVSEPFPVVTIKYRAAAITSNGTGPYSAESAPITTTLPPAPGSGPAAFAILSLVPGNNSIDVTWEEPTLTGNGGPVGSLTYTVQYSTDGINWTTAP